MLRKLVAVGWFAETWAGSLLAVVVLVFESFLIGIMLCFVSKESFFFIVL
jgi:hypothetical protein